MASSTPYSDAAQGPRPEPGPRTELGPRREPGPSAELGPSAESGWLTWLARIIPAITAFAVADYGISRPSLWRDEAYTIVAASRSPAQIFDLLRHSDAVHGAYYLCMHVVIATFGRAETAVRLPSAVATAITAGLIAALGTRLVSRSGGRWPQVFGLLAGLLYGVAPFATRYAQEARSYATVAGLAIFATYALVRALEDDRRGWWACYAIAIAAIGHFNLFGLLILPAHAVTVLMARPRGRSPGGEFSRSDAALAAPPHVRRWIIAVASAAVLLVPVAVGAYLERADTAWLGQPGLRALGKLALSFAGSRMLQLPVGALVVIATCAGLAAVGRRRFTTTTVCLPWLVLPPATLLAAAQIHPVYNVRYVVFCLPAVALLAADGLSWLTRFTAEFVSPPAPAAVALLPAFAIVVLVAVAAVAPQQALRNPESRPDNLRKVSEIITRHARPGDAVLYITSHSRIVSQGYPGPFRKLRDVALAESPVASATLNGTEVGEAVLRRRFTAVRRVWVISDNGRRLPHALDRLDAEKLALVKGLRRLARWHTSKDLLLLYERSPA